MSNKKTEAIQAEGLDPQEVTTEVSVKENEVDMAALLEKSSSLGSLQTVVSLSPESIVLDKVGESFRGVFMGFGEMIVNDPSTEEGKRTIPSVKFLVDKKMRINGGAVLLSEIKSAGVTVGTPLEVTYTEKKGNVKIYSITLLG
jgi:hypothetical protein